MLNAMECQITKRYWLDICSHIFNLMGELFLIKLVCLRGIKRAGVRGVIKVTERIITIRKARYDKFGPNDQFSAGRCKFAGITRNY